MSTDFITGAWEVLKEIWGWFEFLTFIDEWEEAVVLQTGKFRRVLKPGWWLILPFALDEVHTMNVKITALELDEQALTTGDGQDIVVKGVLMWSIFDIRKAICDVEDAEDTLGDIALGIIQDMVESQDWDYIKTPECRTEIKKAIQKQARKWGITASTFKYQSIVRERTFKVFGEI